MCFLLFWDILGYFGPFLKSLRLTRNLINSNSFFSTGYSAFGSLSVPGGLDGLEFANSPEMLLIGCDTTEQYTLFDNSLVFADSMYSLDSFPQISPEAPLNISINGQKLQNALLRIECKPLLASTSSCSTAAFPLAAGASTPEEWVVALDAPDPQVGRQR